MTIIYCQEIHNTADAFAIKDKGIANVELSISQLLAKPADEIELMTCVLAQAELKTTSFTGLLPAEVSITEPGFNSYIWEMHSKKALQKIHDLGGTQVTLDNGPSRFLHWEHEQLEAKQQLIRYVSSVCEYAEKLGINLLVEPLVAGYTNHLQSIQDIVEFVKLVNMPNLGISVPAQLLLEVDASQLFHVQRINVSPAQVSDQNSSKNMQSALTNLLAEEFAQPQTAGHRIVVSLPHSITQEQVNALIL